MNRSSVSFAALLVSLPVALAACSDATAGEDLPDSQQPVEIDAAPAADFCNATDPRTVPVEIVATPEASEAPYLAALEGAQTSIRLEVYLMGYGGILDLLRAKAEAGVDVKVILDKSKISTNQKYMDLLVASGAEVTWSAPQFTYLHSKFFVVDDEVAVMSTGNFSKSYSIDYERNFVATDRDPADVADLVTLFDADWAGTTPPMDCTRLIVSPVNARERILALIESAQSTLTIESMQFADGDVRDAVAARVAAGVDVRVLLADPSWIDANAAAATFLHGLDVPVKMIPHLHTKAIVADGVRGYVGSENLSWTSLDKNREVGVIVVEPSSIAPISATFDKDWAAGTDL